MDAKSQQRPKKFCVPVFLLEAHVTPRSFGCHRHPRTNEHMASPAEYGSVPAGDVHVEFGSSGSTQTRWSMGKVIGAVLVVRQRVPISVQSF